MNIGIVTTWFERGAAYVSRAYMDTLSRKHKVFIYARSGEKYAKGDTKWDKPYVTWEKKFFNNYLTYINWSDFKEWAKRNSLDLIIFNEQQDWEVILRTIKELKIIIGAYIDFYTNITIPFFRLYDFLLCNTKRHYSVFKDNPQAFFIPWGTDIDLFKPIFKAEQKNFTFFHSSGMNPIRKGTDLLLDAFYKVKGNHRLIIHAQKSLDNYPEIYEKASRDTRVTIITKEVGSPGLYYLGDIYVYPSRLEGIGLTIPEALASGLPVITSNSPPMNEFVINGSNGSLVNIEKNTQRADGYYWPENVCSTQHLTECMQYFVDNPAEVTKYKKTARVYAVENLNWRKNSEILNELINRVEMGKGREDQLLYSQVELFQRRRYKYSPYIYPLILMIGQIGFESLRKKLFEILNKRKIQLK